MHLPSLLVSCAAACALFAALPALSGGGASATPADRPPAAGPGHLVLIVEGTVRALDITAAVAKPDPWGGVPKGLRSPFELRILAEDGGELAVLPLDLSAFDTDPESIGRPLVVQGCLVRDWRIGLLVSVPDFDAAARYRFERDGVAIGEVAGETVRQLRRGQR